MSYYTVYPRQKRIAASRRRLLATTVSGYLAAVAGGLIAVPIGLAMVMTINYLI